MAKYLTVILFVFFCVGSISWALPAPKYLSVPQWEDCTSTITKGSSQFICLPAKKPEQCPFSSWRILKDKHLIDNCPRVSITY